MKVKVGGIKEVSLVDVLFHPSFVIWFSGCNFRCPWCQNGPLVFGRGKLIEIDEIMKKIEENKGFVDFVQATGGEPTLQANALVYLFKKVKSLEIKTSLDTNGSNPRVIKRLIKRDLLDHVAMDVKAPLDESYSKAIGVRFDVKRIEESLRVCEALDFVEIRTTVVPGVLNKEDVLRIAKSLKDYLKDFYYVIQQFNPTETVVDKKFALVEATPQDKLVEIAKAVKNTGVKNVFVRSKLGVRGV